MSKRLKTPEEVKQEFVRAGISVQSWAKRNGFKGHQVYRVLNSRGDVPCARGSAHRIAVMLGLKEGVLADLGSFYSADGVGVSA